MFFTYVLSFKGLAVIYCLNFNGFLSSQIGEILPITLSDIFNLEDDTLMNAELQVIYRTDASSSEEKKEADSTESILKEGLLEFRKLSDWFQLLDGSI